MICCILKLLIKSFIVYYIRLWFLTRSWVLFLYFRNFFKRIRYFSDEEGLIYWGNIKGIKKYGQNYSIKFKNTAKYNNKELFISIYIENETIEKYRKRRLFREQINALVESTEEILCFFVGAYPRLVDVPKKDGTTFLAFNVDVQNLDHIAFILE